MDEDYEEMEMGRDKLTTDEEKWLKSFERLLRKCPKRIGLMGMDCELQVVLKSFRRDCQEPNRYLGNMRNTHMFCSVNDDEDNYMESGGW